ncbi:MAG TPA: PepSY domain-containing protein [Pseudomonadales bacterium]|nr:PepSY domain-containing protein [Pseudomonadales bacterium]HND15085.1 PepSY domain-containing protein [Pseudomonadales bacterium]
MHARSIAAAAVLLLAAATGSARDVDHDEVLQLRRSGELLALEELLERARTRYPGATLLEADLEREKDTLVYELELLTRDGRVRELEFDARSGTLLSDKDED